MFSSCQALVHLELYLWLVLVYRSHFSHLCFFWANSEICDQCQNYPLSSISSSSRASWHSRAVRLWFILSSSRGFWCSRAVRLWFISSFAFGLCSLLLLQHRVVEVVRFSSSWSFEIGTWSLLLSTSSLKLKSRSFIIPWASLYFASLMRLDCSKFHSSQSLRSTTFELLFRTISTWCQLNRHTKCTSFVLDKSRTSEFLRRFWLDLFWVWHLVRASRECHFIHSSRESYPLF
jgi:hypothetical protein